MKGIYLQLAVFICGAVVMVLELAGIRLFAPYLGTSLFVWTSLIGVILASLSLGYWWGGVIADKHPKPRILAFIILVAALLCGFIPIIDYLVLKQLTKSFSDIRLASFITSCLVFTPVSICLGMVTPYAIRLKIDDISNAGQIAGKLYACSTVGSIVGTFGAGYLLFAYIGTLKVFFVLSLTLVLASALVAFSGLKIQQGLLLCAMLLGLVVQQLLLDKQRAEGFVDIDTQYSRVWVRDKKDSSGTKNVRLLENGICGVQGGIYLDEMDTSDKALIDPFKSLEHRLSELTQRDLFRYFEFFDLNYHFNPVQNQSLMIGGGAYVYPRRYLEKFPKAKIDVVEIDPGITEIATQYFGFKASKQINIVHQDGRVFLNSLRNDVYDSVIIDAFTSSCSIPFQLTTKEFISKLYAVLKQNGVVLVNMVAALGVPKGSFFQSSYATYKSVFPEVYAFAMQAPQIRDRKQNIFLVALKSKVKPAFTSSDPYINSNLQHLWKGSVAESSLVLTDDYAPVNYFRAAALR